jgi:amino acid permease
LPKINDGKTGTAGTLSLMFKAVVGSGILALPPAVKSAGLVLGVSMVALMSLLNLYTTRIILLAIIKLRSQGIGRYK